MGTRIRPQMNDESLGMRMFEVNRQRAIERSVERLRHGLKADWHYLSQDDLGNLRWILGELWAISSRAEWDEMHFSKLGLEDTRRIVSCADRLRRHGTQRMSTLDSVRAIVIATRDGVPAGDLALDGASLAY